MKDQYRTTQSLIEEISVLKQRNKELEQFEAERKRSESQLKTAPEATKDDYNNRDLAALLRMMCDNAPDMIWAKDLERRFLFANKATCEKLLNARDTSEPVGKEHMFFAERERLAHPENQAWHTFGEICQDSDGIVMASKMPGHFDEFGNVKGEFLFLDVHKAPLLDERGEMIGTVGSGRDISEHKRVEEEKRHIQEIAEGLAEEQAIISEIGRIIGSSLNIDDVYEPFTRKVKKLIGFDRLSVALHNLEDGFVRIAHVSETDLSARRQGETFSYTGSLNEEVVRRRIGFIVQMETIEEVPEHYSALAQSYKAGVRSAICIPLFSNGQVIGSLNFRSMTPNFYTERDLSLAQRIGDQMAGAIANAQLYANLKRAEQEMAVIAEIGRIIASSLNIDEVYERFTLEAKKLIGFDRLSVALHNIEDGLVRIAHVSKTDLSVRWQGDTLPLAGSINEQIIRTRTGFILRMDSIEEVAEHYPGLVGSYEVGVRSAIFVPLLSHDEVIGNLSFRSRTPEAYTPADLRLAERIAEQIAGAIANAQMFNDLKNTEKSLWESKERLQRAEKMEALGTLAGGVAHDLNNVLGIVVGYSELLLDEIGDANPLRTNVMKIMAGGNRSAAIVQDLLALARRGVQISKAINLNAIIKDCLKAPEFEKVLLFNPKVQLRMDLAGR